MAISIRNISGVARSSIARVSEQSVGNILKVSHVAVGSGATSVSSLQLSHVIPNYPDRVLVVFIPIAVTSPDLSSVVCNGVSLIKVINRSNGNRKVHIYYLNSPPVGTTNLTINYNTSSPYLVVTSVLFSGVNTLAPFKNGTSTTGSASNKNHNVVCSYSNSYILECMAAGGGIHSAASGQINLLGDNIAVSYDTSVVVGNNAQNWNCSTSWDYAWVGCEMRAKQDIRAVGCVSNI